MDKQQYALVAYRPNEPEQVWYVTTDRAKAELDASNKNERAVLTRFKVVPYPRSS